MNKKVQVQQGDVCLEKIEGLPEGVKLISPKNGQIVLAEGEATGHAHTIAQLDRANLFELPGSEKLYLKVEDTVELKHQEHGAITVEAGVYEMEIVNMYDYFEELQKKVVD